MQLILVSIIVAVGVNLFVVVVVVVDAYFSSSFRIFDDGCVFLLSCFKFERNISLRKKCVTTVVGAFVVKFELYFFLYLTLKVMTFSHFIEFLD